MHYPWILDENLEYIKDGEKGTAIQAAIGRLKIVNEYTTLLKKHGVYDNATIVILADHGFNHALGRRPVFLIKQPNAHNKSLIINKRPSTVAELMSFICLRFNSNDYVNSHNDKVGMNRFFYCEEKEGGFSKYKIKSISKERSSWIKVGKVKQYRGGDRTYHIGEVIDFSAYGNSERYKGSGWSINPTVGYSDISQFEAELFLEVVGDLHSDEYTLKMRAHPILSAFHLPYKNITLFLNDVEIAQWMFKNDNFENVTCKIPKNFLNRRNLVLRFVIGVPENFKDNNDVKNNVKFVVETMQIY